MSKIQTPLGSHEITKSKRYRTRVTCAEVEVILRKKDDDQYVYRLSRDVYEIDLRKQLTAAKVQEIVTDMLSGRDDLDDMEIHRVGVSTKNTVWHSPWEDR